MLLRLWRHGHVAFLVEQPFLQLAHSQGAGAKQQPMQLEPAFGLKFSKYLLELLQDNVTGFHCVGVPRRKNNACRVHQAVSI